MTPKEQTLHHLYEARTAQIRWVNTIKLLVSGIDIPEETLPLSPTDSPFGRWYYGQAVRFSLGISQMVLDDIESLFLSMYDKYTKIYPIYYGAKKIPLFGRMLGNRPKASGAEMELAHRYYEEIVALSDKLKHKLRVFESQLQSMGEERFEYTAEPGESVAEPFPSLSESSEPENQTYFYGARGRG